MMQDIKMMNEEFTSVGFRWVNREGNSVVDCVVKLVAANALPTNWSGVPPAVIRALLDADRSLMPVEGRSGWIVGRSVRFCLFEDGGFHCLPLLIRLHRQSTSSW